MLLGAFIPSAEKQILLVLWVQTVLFSTGSSQKWGAQNSARRRSGLCRCGEGGMSFLFCSAFIIMYSARIQWPLKMCFSWKQNDCHLLSAVQMENCVTVLRLFLTISFTVILSGKYISFPSAKSKKTDVAENTTTAQLSFQNVTTQENILRSETMC